MEELNYKKISRGHYYIIFTGISLIALIMLVNVVSAVPSANITFITKGSSFSPIITVTCNPSIQWIFGDGSSSNSKSPTVNFRSTGTRTNTLVVTPWIAVTKINIGYDGSDGGITPSSSTIANLKQQNVIAVSGLENVAPYLQVWASNNNPITSIDFSNFTALQTIECFSCRSLGTIRLNNVPSLTRLCIEESNISYLDLSEAPALEDLRGASQRSSTYTINWGTTGANVWHICVRDNPQITGSIPFSQFPLLRQFFNWNDNQSGTLNLTSTNLKDVESSNNHYNTAVFSSCFPASREGTVDVSNNSITNLDISSDPGLLYLNASFNLLNQTSIDGLLHTLDFYNSNGGILDLTGNAAPSDLGKAHVNNLSNGSWKVKVTSKSNLPIANFTSNVTSGLVPLVIQFNDSSINNPTTWLWDFGDGTYSNAESPSHVYNSPGNYTLMLVVRNENGSDFKVVSISVLEQPIFPLANFDCNVTEGYVPLDVHFTDLSENATEWNWNFGDGTNSTVQNPIHNYYVAGNFSVNLSVSNTNGTSSKTSFINVLQASSSESSRSSNSGSSASGSNNDGSTGSGGAGGSPELQINVEVKELSQTFISSGQNAMFDFPQKATPVVTITFDSKKTTGKTTTIVELLKAKSTLVSEVPQNEVYKYLNIWVGNGGFGDSNNIENAVINFKVEKAWIQDKKIDQSSITLNRYNDKKWNQLSTNFSGEDDKYLYFTAKTPGFSSFAVTGKNKASGTTVQPADGKRQTANVNATPTDTNMENATVSTKQKSDNTTSTNATKKGVTKMPGFETFFGIISLLAVFMHKRK